jgi:hypothetical protein
MYTKSTLIFLLYFLFPSQLFAQDLDFFEPKTTIGGYGELHFNNSKNQVKEWRSQLDFHRFVLYVGHAWSEQWSLNAELELEHNIVGDNKGDLQLEQAFINYNHSQYFAVQAGVILVSSGLINEYHEPNRFFGVERPEYQKVIIPTTWFGNGIGTYGNALGFEYKIILMEGLNSDGFSASSGIRGGRQKGFKVEANNPLFNTRLDYISIPGLRFGASYVYNEAKGDSISSNINLIEFHANYSANSIYAVFEIGNISYSNQEIEASRGFYFDLGYNIASLFDCNSKIIPFFRFSDINTAAKTKSGGDLEKKYRLTSWFLGINYLPIESVVIKIDYGENTYELGSEKTKLLNFGFGYVF